MPVTMTCGEGAEQEFKLTGALLLYGVPNRYDSYSSEYAYATIHNVKVGRTGKPELDAGEPLSVATLSMVMQGLSRSTHNGFLPANILSTGINSAIWWVKPTTRRVWFHSDKIATQTAEVPHPGLVFAVASNGSAPTWSVFAIKGAHRPTPETRLYRPHYFNVWINGQICAGSVNTPKDNGAVDTEAWERAFFESAFTHTNGTDKVVSYERGAYGLWNDLLEGKFQKFPSKALIPTNKTVADLIEATSKGTYVGAQR